LSANAKDTVLGTAKQIVAEIMDDGRLAEEGAHQAMGSPSLVETAVAAPLPNDHSRLELSHMDENRFAALLGHAALKVWAELPRDAQERLFDAAVDDGVIANELAEFLHDHHPKTAHPPRPTRLA
jgi:hypothetical protein